MRSSQFKWDGHPPACWNGWRPGKETWAFQASYSPVFEVRTTGYIASRYSAGMRVKLYHGGAWKYFIIVAVANAAVPWDFTYMYLYGGTDYTLAAGAITDFQYSTDKMPVGFPASPLKWTVRYTRTVTRYYNNPTANVWYNNSDTPGVDTFGQISIPYGLWRVSYQYSLYVQTEAAQTNWSVGATLSKANNSEDDTEFTSCIGGAGASSLNQSIGTVGRSKILNQALAVPDVFYLNLRTTHADMDWIGIIPQYHGKCIIEAESAYL